MLRRMKRRSVLSIPLLLSLSSIQARTLCNVCTRLFNCHENISDCTYEQKHAEKLSKIVSDTHETNQKLLDEQAVCQQEKQKLEKNIEELKKSNESLTIEIRSLRETIPSHYSTQLQTELANIKTAEKLLQNPDLTEQEKIAIKTLIRQKIRDYCNIALECAKQEASSSNIRTESLEQLSYEQRNIRDTLEGKVCSYNVMKRFATATFFSGVTVMGIVAFGLTRDSQGAK